MTKASGSVVDKAQCFGVVAGNEAALKVELSIGRPRSQLGTNCARCIHNCLASLFLEKLLSTLLAIQQAEDATTGVDEVLRKAA